MAAQPFQTKQEIEAYFGQDELPCLICGKAFAGLHAHINAIHDMNVEQYKAEFGIPRKWGLVGQALLAKQSLRFKEQRRTGSIPPSPSPEHIQKLVAAKKTNNALYPATRDALRQARLNIPLPSHSDARRFLSRLLEGRTVRQTAQEADMPNIIAFNEYRKNHPDFNLKVIAALDALPFNLQLEEGYVGNRFNTMLILLHEKAGLEWEQVEEIMQLPSDTAERAFKRIRKAGKLAAYREAANAYYARPHVKIWRRSVL